MFALLLSVMAAGLVLSFVMEDDDPAADPAGEGGRARTAAAVAAAMAARGRRPFRLQPKGPMT
jgi:hypothetical protein